MNLPNARSAGDVNFAPKKIACIKNPLTSRRTGLAAVFQFGLRLVAAVLCLAALRTEAQVGDAIISAASDYHVQTWQEAEVSIRVTFPLRTDTEAPSYTGGVSNDLLHWRTN